MLIELFDVHLWFGGVYCGVKKEFDEHFSKLGLKWFAPSEIRYLGASNESGAAKGLNTLPPEHLWSNLEEVALAADAIREEFGSALQVLSGYRSPAYNAAIGGASQSYHMKGMALDLKPMNGDVKGLLNAIKREGFIGGVGTYPTFVHIDVRGYRATFR